MFPSKLLQITMSPSKLSCISRSKSSYQLKEPVDKCVSHFEGIRPNCVKKEGLGCRSPNSSIKCIQVSPVRICEKMKAPRESFREMLLAKKRHIRRPCVNECCCLDHFVHRVKVPKISLQDVVRH